MFPVSAFCCHCTNDRFSAGLLPILVDRFVFHNGAAFIGNGEWCVYQKCPFATSYKFRPFLAPEPFCPFAVWVSSCSLDVPRNKLGCDWIPILLDDFVEPHFRAQNFHVWIKTVIFSGLDLPDEPLYFWIFQPVLTNTAGISEYMESTMCFKTVLSLPPEKLT